MLDLVLLFGFLFLFSTITRKKSVVFKICNAVLFGLFLFVVLFTTNNPFISNSVAKWVGAENYEIIKKALTNQNSFSYAANSVWLLYKALVLVFALVYGFYIATGYVIKIFVAVRYKFIGTKSISKRDSFNNVNNNFGTKKFLCFERLLN